jgi:hypothetical protein
MLDGVGASAEPVAHLIPPLTVALSALAGRRVLDELTSEERARGGRTRQLERWKDWYRQRWQEVGALLREREEERTAELHEREEELERVRRTIEVTQPEPVPPSRRSPQPEPDIVPEPEQPAGESQAPSGLSVYEQQAARLGLGGPCWEDAPEKRARDEARRRDRFMDC